MRRRAARLFSLLRLYVEARRTLRERPTPPLDLVFRAARILPASGSRSSNRFDLAESAITAV